MHIGYIPHFIFLGITPVKRSSYCGLHSGSSSEAAVFLLLCLILASTKVVEMEQSDMLHKKSKLTLQEHLQIGP